MKEPPFIVGYIFKKITTKKKKITNKFTLGPVFVLKKLYYPGPGVNSVQLSGFLVSVPIFIDGVVGR